MAKSKKKDVKKSGKQAAPTKRAQHAEDRSKQMGEEKPKGVWAEALAAVDEKTKTVATPPAESARDPRLPAPGTVLPKKDRHGAVRCECIVEEGGIRYAGKVYRSLSAAAMAAAKDLGLANKTQNGWNFWGLTKPARHAGDPLVALDHAWERYRGRAAALVEAGLTDENRAAVRAAIEKQAKEIGTIAANVA